MKHTKKIIVLVFLAMKATILDTQGRKHPEPTGQKPGTSLASPYFRNKDQLLLYWQAYFSPLINNKNILKFKCDVIN